MHYHSKAMGSSTGPVKPCFVNPWLPCHRQSFSHHCAKTTTSFSGMPIQLAQPWRRATLTMCESDPSTSQQPKKVREMKPEVKELRSVLKKCSIYLIGPMGSGKSVVGKFLAFELGFRFLDTDELIAAVAKKSISEIFESDGEAVFRDLESAVLDQVAPFIGCCVATGGGAVKRKSNWGKLQTGIVVYLKTPVDVLSDRLKGDTSRPLLKDTDAETLREKLKDILEERRHLYEQADVMVPVGENMALDDVGMEVIRRLTNFIKSNPPRLSALYPGNLPKQ